MESKHFIEDSLLSLKTILHQYDGKPSMDISQSGLHACQTNIKSLPPHDNIIDLLAEFPDTPSPDEFTVVLDFYNGGDFKQLQQHMHEICNSTRSHGYGTSLCSSPSPWNVVTSRNLPRRLSSRPVAPPLPSRLSRHHLNRFRARYHQRPGSLRLGACLQALMQEHRAPPSAGWSKQLTYWARCCYNFNPSSQLTAC